MRSTFFKVTAALAAMLCGPGFLAGCEDAPVPAAQDPVAAALDPPGTDDGVKGLFKPLPRPPIDDPGRVHLGKALFSDGRLSRDGSVSCASCHDVSQGGDDGRAKSVGIDGRTGSRNAPTVLNAALNFVQFWDGRAATLEEQVAVPIHNPAEMDSNWSEVLARLAADEPLRRRFEAEYPDGLTVETVTDAIVAYERALVTWNSPFDRFLGGDPTALSAEARRGYGLFTELGCASCHQGRNLGGNMFQRFGVMMDVDRSANADGGVDTGRFDVTGRPEDRFHFRVPALRNVARTAPYFHDGSAATLEAAVRVMASYQLGRPLTDEQVTAIVAFLESLSGVVDESLL